MDRINIKNTEYEDLFSSKYYKNVFLLEKSHAINFWQNTIDERAASYFRLPDDNWLIQSNCISIGQWIDHYNDNDITPVSKLLERECPLDRNDCVRFCVSKEIIIETNWDTFLKCWDDFLSVDDECPILLSKKPPKKNVIFFTPRGLIMKLCQ